MFIFFLSFYLIIFFKFKKGGFSLVDFIIKGCKISRFIYYKGRVWGVFMNLKYLICGYFIYMNW